MGKIMEGRPSRAKFTAIAKTDFPAPASVGCK